MSYPQEEDERTQRDNDDLEEKPEKVFPVGQPLIVLQYTPERNYL